MNSPDCHICLTAGMLGLAQECRPYGITAQEAAWRQSSARWLREALAELRTSQTLPPLPEPDRDADENSPLNPMQVRSSGRPTGLLKTECFVCVNAGRQCFVIICLGSQQMSYQRTRIDKYPSSLVIHLHN